jgi:hypothetical protein
MRWRRRQEPVREVNHVGRIPDGDRVLAPGQRRWADLLWPTALDELTQPLPTLPPQAYRSRWQR